VPPKAPSSPGVRKRWSRLTRANAATLLKLIDALEDDDDVQTVWGNYDVSDEVMANAGLMIILGLDPGLGTTGWGVIVKEGNRLSHIDNGEIRTDAKLPLANRLLAIDEKLRAVLDLISNRPDCAAVEEVFVNKNPQSTLKLGQARGVVLLGAARNRTPVTEYAARLVKKSVVGTGKADKDQIAAMLRVLMPGLKLAGEDAADALAVAGNARTPYSGISSRLVLFCLPTGARQANPLA
jgi:crossover junction endodeoxyribonuclease RuvC